MALKARPSVQRAVAKERKTLSVRVNERALAFAKGELTWEDLDDEELARGQLRSSAGDFRGRPADMVPREMMQAATLAHRQRTVQGLQELAPKALKALATVMDRANPQPGDNAKVSAATKVLEYNIGKVPDKVEINSTVTIMDRNAQDVLIVDDMDEYEDAKEIEA